MNGNARTGEPRIGKQIVLPWSKAVEIAAKSVKVRFWRSMITMSSIVLAIAFLMSIWTSTAITASLAVGPQLDMDALDAEIAALETRIGFDPDAQRTLDGLKSRRAELQEMKGNVDAILQEERGEVEEDAIEGRQEAEAALGTSVTDFISRMTPTDTWLAILALLVCLVGIANAMFMTVQERFREIGTMKCLGAMDGFIVKIFLIESAALGLIGTLLGVSVGMLLSALRQLIVYGGPALTYFPWPTVFVAGMLAALIGLVLSIGAAIWPATKAARMEPVEAMRVDE
jgi:ABC-type antimicrobial peptide transport system permease subunit